jgi:hypothetical protein
MPRPALLVLLLFAIGCESPPQEAELEPTVPEPVAPPTWQVTPTGIGTIQAGWTLAQLNASLGDQLAPTYEYNEECDHVMPAGVPRGVSLMVIKDTVMRVNVDSAGVLTIEGAGVGDSEARIDSLYQGRVTVEPHKYTDGHYLVVKSPNDTLHQLIFETDGQRVVRYRSGQLPYVRYIEGCS